MLLSVWQSANYGPRFVVGVVAMNPQMNLKTRLVPHSKHFVTVIQTSQLMLYREIIAVCSEIHTKHILCGRNAEFWQLNLVVHKLTIKL